MRGAAVALGQDTTEDDMAKLTKDEVVEACARAAHEVNRAYCIALGDTSQVSWDEAPDWQKSSARLGAIGVIDHGNGPKDSHDSWLKQKEAEGWKYGPVKDVEKKEHPCFLPYGELPVAQRLKDRLFVNTVGSMAGALIPQADES